jgi:hypothetical protein
MIAFVNIVEPGTRLLRVPFGLESLQLVSVVFSFAATWAFIFMLQISQIIGGRTLRDWVLGRYHRPRRRSGKPCSSRAETTRFRDSCAATRPDPRR